jgi:alkylation response protein AidB-like acyl-CoA dehydrogenase
LERVATEVDVRRLMETDEGWDPAAYARAAGELGWPALTIPENNDGAGFGPLELNVVLEECGRALWPSPLFATAVLAVTALLESGDVEAQDDYLPRIAAGELRATVAVPMSAATAPRVAAQADGKGWRVDGSVDYVIDGHTAGLALMVASSPEGPIMVAVESGSPGLTAVLQPTLDLTRKLARITVSGTPARRIGEAAETDRIEQRVRWAAAVGLAAEQVGAAERVLEMTTAYAKDRRQFGRPIGSFQAVKHRLADMLIDVESARAAAINAASCLAADDPTLPEAAAIAKAFCSEASLSVAGAAIQLHGGIGFTWEHPAHLYFKRAKSSQLMFGDPTEHRLALAARVGI